ncbi:MAG: EAL domain-containing protein [Selenomonadaceae bacterium]|nr:EAL domain-containing protein [Selenomonadaceae bacterium]
MEQTSQKDALTGLPSMTCFKKFSQNILSDAEALKKGIVFIHFDVKNFRAFSYLHGFDESDRLLTHVADVIAETFPEYCVARCFNDRFILVARNLDVERRIKIVRNAVAFFNRHEEIIMKAGVYVVPNAQGETTAHAQECAEIACEAVKDSEKVHFAYFNNELGKREKLRRHIVESINESATNDYIKVYYQPIVHVVNGRICAYEGLARWEDPQYGFLSPADFIGVLEDARLIHKLDVFVLRKICSQMKMSMERGFPIVPVSINLSALDFQFLNMPYLASEALRINNLPKNLLNIEITERALGENRQEIYDVLEKFKRNGFEIWLDNFGSKYSSLNVLEEINFDLLKIDKRFLQNFHTKERSRLILKNIMNMAKELGIRTLMEGVEDEVVLEFLRQTGCESAQGFLFGRPTSFDMLDRSPNRHENPNERKYYNAIGRVNLLSQTPLKTGWSAQNFENISSENISARISTAQDDLNFMLNGLPLAISEFDGQRFKFLVSNAGFRNIFKNLGLGEKCLPNDVFNNFSLPFSMKIRSTAQQCIKTGAEDSCDFVTSEGFFSIRLRCIAYNSETKTSALLAIVDYISTNLSIRKEKRQNVALKFLYTLYSRIDLIHGDGTEVENIYISSSRYIESFVKGSVAQSIKNFAEKNIHVEDRIKFEKFFDLETIEERINEVGGTHVTDYFRTRNERHNFTWQMYIIIPMIYHGKKYFLSCARNIDAERTKRLPEIDNQGMEYYDMPGNPIFLLLASRSFTSILGYGSFEQFLYNSFYLEADLTTDRILYMHLGKQTMSNINSNYISRRYSEVIRDVVLNTVAKNSQNEIAKFFNRKKLLSEYERGKISAETEFLSRADSDAEPRWLHAVYQVREAPDVNEVHAFFLMFDIDAYRRTNEAMISLIERDNLTGVYNRRTAVNLIQKFMVDENFFAFVILDLDNFKQINDRFGHDCGDGIIKDAASRMTENFEDTGIIARLGGDEFLVILKNLSPLEIEECLKNFSAQEKFIYYNNQQVSYTMSIGYSIFPEQGESYRELYQNADMALYAVKMAGRNSFQKFSMKMIAENRAQLGVSLSKISEGMPGGFLIYKDNDAQEILYANTRLWKIYDCESLEQFRKFTGNSFKGCVHPHDWEKVHQTIYEQIEISAGYDYVRYRIKTASGDTKIIEDFGRRVHSTEDGDIFYVFIIDFLEKEKLWDFVKSY